MSEKNTSSNLFFSKKESWWWLSLSLILSGGLLVEPQLITAALKGDGLTEMWVLWCSVLGTALGKSFFAHLWVNIPIKTENELILFRYSGVGAKILHIFRSVYVGGIVVPFILCFNILAFSRVLSVLAGFPLSSSIVISTSIILMGTFFNSFRQRIKSDAILLLIFIVLFAIITSQIIINSGGLSLLQQNVSSSKYHFHLFPTIGTTAFYTFLVYITVQWWSTSIVDFPDMQGQKLLAGKSARDIAKIILLPILVGLLFDLFAFTLPFIAVTRNTTEGITNPEMAFISVFQHFLSPSLVIATIFMFLIQFVSLTHNNQNWGGSLLIENLYKIHIRPCASNKEYKLAGLIAMASIVVLSGVIALHTSSIFEMTKYLLTITAGVGPVFMLRWYWHRINAWTQLSAMISALILPNIYDLLFERSFLFSQFITHNVVSIGITPYSLKVIILTIAVCTIWLIVTFLTPKTDETVLLRFAQTVKPGGFWPKHIKQGTTNTIPRLIAWLLQSLMGISSYVLLWFFITGSYLRLIIGIVGFVVVFLITFVILKQCNTRYEQA